MKKVFIIIGFLLGFFVLLFVFGLFDLGFFKFFAPKYENVRREVFENTKSFTHGKIQDLSKYYQEYNKADSENDKAVIKTVIQSQFAEFDVNKLNSPQLKQFLINMRGY